MNGKDLQKAIKNSGIKVKELVKLSKIPEQTIYSLYKKPVVEDHFIQKIKKAGVKLIEQDQDESQEYYKELIVALQEVSKMQKERIAELERQIQEFRNQVVITNPIKPKQKPKYET